MAGTDLYPVAGKKFFIGGIMATKKEDFVAADFDGQDWTEVDGWETHGAIGDAGALITTALINRGRDVKQKGTANGGSMQNNFAILSADPGQIALIAAAQPANKNNYAFKIEGNDAPAAVSKAVTMTIANPGVITWTAHGLVVGNAVKFSTTGALPTGITAGTVYYVKTAPDADTFTIAATPGGTAITTTGTQSGTHTGSTVPAPSMRMFVGLATSATEQGGGANTAQMLQSTVEVNSNIVKVDPAPSI